MTVWQAMSKLEDMGYTFIQNGDSLKAVIIGKAPSEASTLMEIIRGDRAAAADYVRQRENGATVVDDGCTYSVLDALAIAQAVQRGAAVLLAPVIYHKQQMTVSVCWQPTHGAAEAVLEWHREHLLSALNSRLKAMERQALDGMSAEEVEALSDKYSLYTVLVGLAEA